MSLILDALNRSRHDEESLSRSPGLAAAPVEPGLTLPWWQRWVPLVALSLVLVILFALYQWLMVPAAQPQLAELSQPTAAAPVDAGPAEMSSAMKSAAPAARPTAQPVVRSVPATPALPATGAESRVAAPEGADQRAAVAELYARNVTTPVTEATPEVPEVRPEARETPTEDSSLPTRNTPTPNGASGADREEPLDVEQMLGLAQRELATIDAVEHSVPLLVDLSQQFKDGVPTLYYTRHDYSTQEGLSEVVLNGESLREGDAIESGLTLVEILPDAIVLEQQGTQFRLQSLNSWVNL